MKEDYLVQFFLCGAIAITISAIELGGSTVNKPTLRATHWIILRVLIDLGTAIAAILILESALSGLDWFTGAWPALVAGLCGPALIRSQLAILGSGQEEKYYGPANRYSQLREWIDSSIDDIGSAVRSTRISEKVIPRIKDIPLEELGDIIERYIKDLNRLPHEEKMRRIEYTHSTLQDEATSEKEKLSALVNMLLDVKAMRLIRRLEKDRKKLPVKQDHVQIRQANNP